MIERQQQQLFNRFPRESRKSRINNKTFLHERVVKKKIQMPSAWPHIQSLTFLMTSRNNSSKFSAQTVHFGNPLAEGKKANYNKVTINIVLCEEKSEKRKHKRPRNTENKQSKAVEHKNRPEERRHKEKEERFLWPCFMNEVFSLAHQRAAFCAMKALSHALSLRSWLLHST